MSRRFVVPEDMMKILLPPSETKHPGGHGNPLDLGTLAMPELTTQRHAVLDALIALAADPSAAQRVLKLSTRQFGEVEHNRTLRSAPTMPAIDRYTGVLYDALDARALGSAARRWLGAHAWIQSAPFGIVGALDAIPAYRLAAGTSLPGVAPLRRHWADATSAAIGAARPSFVLDLRSEAYVALGPIPEHIPAAYVRVVTDEGGSSRALNHFNKKAKGELVRALAEARPRIRTREALLTWSDGAGIRLRESSDRRLLELVV